MGNVEEALTRFSAGEMEEDELRTIVLTALQRGSRAEVTSIIQDAAQTETLQEVCARLMRDMLQADATPEPPTPIAYEGMVVRDRFILGKEIGRGGMGVVYRARDLRRVEADDRHSEVAIKVMNQTLQHHPDALMTLQREARRAQQLAHPNIATVFDFDREGDIAYLCMELLEGKPLSELLKEETLRPVDFSLSIIRGICAGLEYAHKSGIVHADLKPGNIFLTRNNVVKILDFGLARTVRVSDETAGTETSFDAGRWNAMTPAYASPEMFARQEPDPCDDIYGLACVSYELLSGHHPFERLTATRAREDGLSVKPIRGLSRRQNKTLKDALAFEREDRIATVAEFLDGLMKPKSAAPTVAVTTIGVAAVLAVVGVTWLFINAGGGYTGDPLDSGLNRDVRELPATDAEPGAPDLISEPGTDDANFDDESAPDGNLSRESQESIQRILEIADLHLAMRRFVTPSGSNAAEAYLAVTTLEPSNQRARNGLGQVIDGVVAEARVLARNGDREGAITLLETALSQLPDDQKLQAAHSELLSADAL